MATVKMILAVGPDGLIGKGDKLAWHSKRDLQHFKDLTNGYPCIFGDVTYFGLPVRPLPNRINCVAGFDFGDVRSKKEGHFEARFIEDYLDMFEHHDAIWICGGSSIYNYCMRNDRVDEVYLTRVSLYEYDKDDETNVYLSFDLDEMLNEEYRLVDKVRVYEDVDNVEELVFEKWAKV